MGDRANITIEQGDGSRVWLYTHWSGSELPETLQSALKRGRDRWDDGPYLARIIFNEMTKGNEMDLTSYGISTRMNDNDGYPVLACDPDKQTVTLEKHEGDTVERGKTLTMEAFIAIPDMDWETLKSA